MNTRNKALAAAVARMALFSFAGLGQVQYDVLQAQVLKTMDYLVMKGGEVVVVADGQPVRLNAEMALTPTLKVSTNGVLHVRGKERMLRDGQKLTLDGFWLANDGMLIQVDDHYMLKDGKLNFVRDGKFTPVNQEVVFQNGTRLGTDGAVMTSRGGVVRLQDGQMLTPEGATLPALDHVMKKDGKIVLQKDGSILGLPPARLMVMSEGTKVKGDGTIVMREGKTFVLAEGQRLTLEGAVMPKLP